MKQTAMNVLACPLDGTPLVRKENSVFCPHNHCFDFDRKGALNLLPVQFKASKEPGDSKEMVAARSRFLQGGFYQPIADRLNQLIAGYAALTPSALTVFDAGCGEGYYTRHMHQALADLNLPQDIGVIGMDISKDAIQTASTRSKDIVWLVGTNKKIPVQDASINIVTSLFGFPVFDEFKRILKTKGILITVDPATDHLIELRRVLYAEIKPKDPANLIPVEGLSLVQEIRVTDSFSGFVPEDLQALLMMTPHGYRAKAADRDRALETPFEKITLDVFFRVYAI